MAAELPLYSDVARHVDDLFGEQAQRIGHAVDGIRERGDFTFGFDHDFLREVTVGDCRDNLDDAAHLARQIARHLVDIIGEILPRSRDPLHLRLTAELAVGTDFLRDAGDFRSERVELIDHRIDGAFELEDFAACLDCNLLGEVTLGNRGRHLGNVSDLRREISSEHIHAVGEILPGARDALHVGLPPEFPLGSDLRCDARDLRRKGTQLIHHHVDGVLESENLPLRVDGDLL